jgi:RecA/RadA recombinase
MVKPFDLTKFRKNSNKKLGIQDGFFDPLTWIDTGNFALNKMLSGDFNRGIPLGAVTVFAGESGSGKSYVVSGNIVRNAQKIGVTPIVIDTEGALYEEWVKKLGVDVDPDTIYRAPASMIDDVAKIINEVMEQYRTDNTGKPREEQQKVLFVIDSLGMLQTPTEVDQFDKADMKGDMGRKPRQLKALVTNCIRLFNGWEVGLVATNHTYKSQDQYNRDDVISGGAGFIYAASMIVALNKKKLREEIMEGGKKKKVVHGIVSTMKCWKSRFAKPFEEVDVEIPYSTGMDPYSGVFDMFKESGSIKQSGSWYTATFKDGSSHKQQGNDFPRDILDRLMAEFSDDPDVERGVDETPVKIKIELESDDAE